MQANLLPLNYSRTDSLSRLEGVSFGDEVFGALFERLNLGHLVFLHGAPSCLALSELLCVQAQLALTEGGLASKAIFIDGGNTFDPCLIAEYAEQLSLDNDKVLENILVSRAFTFHDTPEVIRKCIEEMLTILAKREDPNDFYNRVPESIDVLKKCVHALRSGRIELDDLVIERHLSREVYEYRHEVLQAIAAQQLVKEKVEVRAGQSIRFIIINSESRVSKNRVLAAELVDERTSYDVDRYLELLFSSAATILAPFGYTVPDLKRAVDIL